MTTADALVINRASTLPAKVALALHLTFYDSLDPVRKGQVDRICTALGVGQPEQQVRESDLRTALRHARNRLHPTHSDTKAIDRIEQVLEGKKP